MDADASNDAVGAVLSQVTDGAEHPVYFHSRVLKDAERAYSVTEREALAVVVAVVKFRPYILGRTTVVRTDHIPIMGLLRKRDLTGRCARWKCIWRSTTSSSSRGKGRDIRTLTGCLD